MRLTTAKGAAALAASLAISLACAGPGAVAPAAAKQTSAEARASVIGGREAGPGQYPWMAFVAVAEGEELAACSGSVLAPRVVLTAAHCVFNEETGARRDPSGFSVATGAVNWTSPERQASSVNRLIPYPKFGTARDGFGDVAVLELATPTTVPSIPLATGKGFLHKGTHARMAGWGMTWFGQPAFTQSLMWTKTVVEGTPCEGLWGRICVVDFPKFASGACFGDSGGPLFAYHRKRRAWVQFGIVQGGFDRCTTRRSQIFTRTDLLAKWIKGRVAKIEGAAASAPAG